MKCNHPTHRVVSNMTVKSGGDRAERERERERERGREKERESKSVRERV